MDAFIGKYNANGTREWIRQFVLAVNEPDTYTETFGIPPALHGDTGGDGDFDYDDISGFVTILGSETGPESAPMVPEPRTIALALFGLLARCVSATWHRSVAATGDPY